MLNYNEFGNGPSLLIAHGLYGSARNWGVIAKRLSDSFRVITVDMRNHGESPHFPTHSYPDMAEDLAQVIRHVGAPMHVLGHSMGGKAAMTLALNHPELVQRLLIADIAPVAYSHTQMQYLDAMKAVDLSQVNKRSDAAKQLEEHGVGPELQSFFTQSLDLQNKRWRLNFKALTDDMDKIVSYPEMTGRFEGSVLFLAGALSDYILPEYREATKALFPKAKFVKIPKAGHWLHAERPRAFEAAVRAYLQAAT